MNAEVDQTIRNIERLYQSVTGAKPSDNGRPYASIPPEIDAQKHIEGMLDQLLALVAEAPARSSNEAPWAPPVAVWETDREVVATIDLAGVAREDIEVRVRDGLLEVQGRRRPPWLNGTAGARLRMAERPFGAFRRLLALPPGIKLDEVTAHMRDGALELRVPHARGRSQQPTQAHRTIAVK